MSELRVWHMSNAVRDGIYVPVKTVDEAVCVLDQLAQQDLQSDWVAWNAQGLEQFEDGEWSEWYNDDGDDIDAVRAARAVQQ